MRKVLRKAVRAVLRAWDGMVGWWVRLWCFITGEGHTRAPRYWSRRVWWASVFILVNRMWWWTAYEALSSKPPWTASVYLVLSIVIVFLFFDFGWWVVTYPDKKLREEERAQHETFDDLFTMARLLAVDKTDSSKNTEG